jgi:type I restriction enzyme, S subunit
MTANLLPYPSYRPSGLPWLDQVPAGWQVLRIKNLLQEFDQRTSTGEGRLLSLRMREGLIDHIAAGGKRIPPSALVGYKLVEPGTLVMNRMRAASGLFGIAKEEGFVSPDYATFKPTRNANAPYLADLFKSLPLTRVFRAESKGLGTGESGFLRLYSDRFGAIHIPLPPVDEQLSILRFVGHLDRTVIRYVRAKLKLIELVGEQKRRIISDILTRGVDADAPLKLSGIDWPEMMPAHWEIRRVKSLCASIIDCKNRTPVAVDDGDYLVVRTTCVRDGSFDPRGSFRTGRGDYDVWTSRGAPRSGDVFFTREAPAGEACLVPDRSDLCMGQRMMYLRPNPDLLDSKFLLLSIYGPIIRSYIEMSSNGSTVGHLKLGQVSAMPILWCPVREQRAIVATAEELTAGLDSTRRSAMQEIELLREYRARLIADVVTGQLDVRGAASRLSDEDSEPGEMSLADDILEGGEGTDLGMDDLVEEVAE